MPAAAQRILTEAQFRRGIKLDKSHMDKLNELARGEGLTRNSGVTLGALKAKLDHGYAKPAQEHELSGSVTIQVVSPLMGAPGSARQAKVTMSADLEPQVLSLQQGLITPNMSTEIGDSGAVIDSAITAEVVIEAGRLGPPEPRLTVEERRAATRDEWKREQAALRGDGDV